MQLRPLSKLPGMTASRSRSTGHLTKEADGWLTRTFQMTAQMDMFKLPPLQ